MTAVAWRQAHALRAAFAHLLATCEALDVEPVEIHVGQQFGYYEVNVQVSTADEVTAVADALGIPGADVETDHGSLLRQQEPWDDAGAVLPLARPGDLYRADRLQVVAYNVRRRRPPEG